MRSALRLLASTTGSSIGNPLKPLPLALLPPIPLYRRILRAHRKNLQHEQRVLGDMYVKSEFRAHREVDNPVHIVGANQHRGSVTRLTLWTQIGFLSEWQMYVQQIEGDSWRDAKMDKHKIDKMSGRSSLVLSFLSSLQFSELTRSRRSADCPTVRAHASHSKARTGRA